MTLILGNQIARLQAITREKNSDHKTTAAAKPPKRKGRVNLLLSFSAPTIIHTTQLVEKIARVQNCHDVSISNSPFRRFMFVFLYFFI